MHDYLISKDKLDRIITPLLDMPVAAKYTVAATDLLRSLPFDGVDFAINKQQLERVITLILEIPIAAKFSILSTDLLRTLPVFEAKKEELIPEQVKVVKGKRRARGA